MLNLLWRVSLAFLAAAVSIYVAVRLLEAVAAALVVIYAVLGGALLLGFAAKVWWRWREANRW